MTLRRKIWIAIGSLFGLVVVVVGAGVAFLATYDWNNARDWIGEKVTERTGRKLVIQGNLQVRLFSMQPSLRAEQVTFANADWGDPRPMLEADRVGFSLSLRDLLRRDIVLPVFELANASALLERDADGRRNWILKAPERTHEGSSPQILKLVINDSRIRVKDRISNSDVDVRVQSQPGEETYGMKIAATGRVRGVPLNVKGESGGLLQLMEEEKPYPIRLEGTLGDSRASAVGTLTGLATVQNLDLDMTISGGNLAPLGDVLKLSLPHTKPYKLSGKLQRRGASWVFRQFKGTVGPSDLAGDFAVNIGGARPMLTAELRSKSLDIADLGGFVGTRPGQTDATRRPGKLLPDEPINLERLRRADAKVHLVATRFQNAGKVPLDNLDARLSLENGVLKFDPVVFGVAEGRVQTSVAVDARKPVIAADVTARFQKLHLNRLIPGTAKLDASIGAVNGSLRLAGRGNSPAALLATANGRTDLYSSGGQTSNLLMEFAGADLAEIVKFWVGGDKKIALRCAVLAFDVNNGVAQSRVMVVDTEDTVIGGDGRISLRDETLDLTLIPLPKDFSIFALRGPLRVTGTFDKPSAGLEKKSLARRVGATLLLGLINPLAALLPNIETGPGKDAPCSDLIAQVESAARPQNEGRAPAASREKPS